jgi:recombinational DNA repair protein RecR
MFKELHLIGGIGAKTAHNIHWKFTKDVQQDPNMISAISAKQRKTEKSAKCRELTGIR